MKILIYLPFLFLIAAAGGYQESSKYKSFSPGKLWYDDKDSLINAHGGGILYDKGTYFWFGEQRGMHRSEGVSVYSSKDLYNWKKEALALAPDADTTSDIANGCVMERPKVLFNRSTGKYVMWFHLELRGQGYKAARAAVAVSDKVTGPYRFIKSFRPNGNMFRDMTLFADDDGTAYAIYAARENYDMRMVKLSDDYLSATTADSLLFSKHREAPAIFKYNNNYYLYSSACTGWKPNKASLHVAPSPWGPWKETATNPLEGDGADSTFGGQPAYILPLPGKKKEFVFIADRWNPRDLRDSRYLFLPVHLQDDLPLVSWKEEWTLHELGSATSQGSGSPVLQGSGSPVSQGSGPTVSHRSGSLTSSPAPHSFALGDSAFLLDGHPFQMISGEMHYTRVPREAWRQRMKMAKAMGLNTIGTYVFWNMHEPEKGKFDFSGNNDIAAFVRTAQQEGLWVVLRPSPYICAEWEFGGYPYWLQKENGLVVRSKEPKYLEEYKTYIRQVGKELAPLQINHGGNILMVQIENEYGSYGNDKEYLDINRQLFIDAGFDGLLYTCDPPADVAKGHLPGLLPAVNGVDQPQKIKQVVRANHDGKGPYFVAEWYPAWFDWWGTKHHTIPAEKYVHRLDSVLSAGLSINMYMFHGGTTRGFMNGANYNDRNPYEPQISSYDYDAPLDEAGNVTEKFMKFREVIQKHLPAGQALPELPPARSAISIPSITFTAQASLFDLLPKPVADDTPLSFEDLDQAYGYVLYRTVVDGGGVAGSGTPAGGGSPAWLKINDLRDFGIVFVNGKKVGVLDRRLRQDSLQLELPKGKVRLDILVENLGRINFGPYLLKNTKGITGKVEWAGQELKGWQMFSLPFTDLQTIHFANKGSGNGGAAATGFGVPLVKKGNFTIDQPADSYLDMGSWGKGCVWVNGHHLGRYWQVGPQQTVYVPAEWLKKGNNEIVTFELLKPEQDELKGIDHPVLSELP